MVFDGCDPGASQFIEQHFHDCVYTSRDYVGFCLGLSSILLWIVAQASRGPLPALNLINAVVPARSGASHLARPDDFAACPVMLAHRPHTPSLGLCSCPSSSPTTGTRARRR